MAHAPAPGDYYTIDVMGEPVVIVRGTDGIVRALNTACRHRAMPVVTDRGNARRFVCPYHSWAYATGGRLVAAPHMEGSRVFNMADRPDGPERTRVLGGYLLWKDLVSSDPEIAAARAALIEWVNEEDALATTELARAMRSRKAPRGPLSPFEKTLAQFYRYLGRTLARDQA